MKSPEEPPVFPYSIIWEEHEERWVSIANLRVNEQEYDTLFEALGALGADTPYVSKSLLGQIADRLAIDSLARADLVDAAFLIAGWYLAPAHQRFLGADQSTSGVRLKKIAKKARELEELIGQIPPKLAAVMVYVRTGEPQARRQPGVVSAGDRLSDELHDLALVADRVVNGITSTVAGRKTEFIRDTAIRLLLEAVERAGCGPVPLSEGTSLRPYPHFGGEGGAFIRSFFELVDPGTTEATLVAPAKRSRRAAKARSNVAR